MFETFISSKMNQYGIKQHFELLSHFVDIMNNKSYGGKLLNSNNSPFVTRLKFIYLGLINASISECKIFGLAPSFRATNAPTAHAILIAFCGSTLSNS